MKSIDRWDARWEVKIMLGGIERKRSEKVGEGERRSA